jgi:hypothetical protein
MRSKVDDDETMQAPIEVLIGIALRSISVALDGIPDSPQSRGLRTTAAKYERALETWKRSAPSSEQRGALRELVFALQSDVERLVLGEPIPDRQERR